MLSNAKQRAEKHGVPFKLTSSDIIIPTYCPVFGLKLTRGKGRGGFVDASPSLDRIKPEVGYVPGNVLVISMRANRAKSNLTPDELLQLADFYSQIK